MVCNRREKTSKCKCKGEREKKKSRSQRYFEGKHARAEAQRLLWLEFYPRSCWSVLFWVLHVINSHFPLTDSTIITLQLQWNTIWKPDKRTGETKNVHLIKSKTHASSCSRTHCVNWEGLCWGRITESHIKQDVHLLLNTTGALRRLWHKCLI